MFPLLRRFLRPYRGALAGVVILQLVQALASLYLPTLNADIIDNGVAAGDIDYIWRTGALMLAVTVLQVAASIAAVWFGAQAAMALGRDLRAAVFSTVNEFSEREVREFGAPSLITRSTNDVQQVQMLVLMTATMLVAAPILAIGGVIMALRQDVGLSWLIAVSAPSLIIALFVIGGRMIPLFRKLQDRIDTVNRVLREQLTGIRVVRAFTREERERARFDAANTDVFTVSVSVGRLFVLAFPLVFLILDVSSVAVVWFGADRVASGEIQVGTLFAFLNYLMQILMALMMASFIAFIAPRALVSAERIGAVLGRSSSVAEPSQPKHVALDHREGVRFDGVGFTYPGAEQPVLSDITVSARPGTVTAVVGSTGSGKSTLLNLVPRLFDATAGAVIVDGQDARAYALDDLWDRIGIVPQKAFLFSGTIASNVRYGKSDASDDEIWEALRVAQADDFVRELPDGLDASVAQGGMNFSGGQRQRLAIARAVIKRPGIYLFDDCFSALDTATDARVRRELAAFTQEATVIMVASRVATVREADQIVVLDDGRVVGVGTHRELLAESETYREIVESQITIEEAA